MLELSFLRLGQSDFSRENRFCGSIDPPLKDVGVRLARAFGGYWKEHGWSAIWASPATRTLQTAGPIAASTGRVPRTDEGLREIAYGEWESLRHDDLKADSPEAYAWWAADPASRGTPGGETAFHAGDPRRRHALAGRPARREGNLRGGMLRFAFLHDRCPVGPHRFCPPCLARRADVRRRLDV